MLDQYIKEIIILESKKQKHSINSFYSTNKFHI